MSDATQATAIEQPQLTEAQAKAIKDALEANLATAYREFVGKINNMPTHPHAKQISFQFFDTGLLWFKEAIHALPTMHMPVKDLNAPQQEAQPQQETAQETAPAPQAPANDASQPLDAA